ncbi:hypothetical protein CCP3SC1AL1_730012 [Gammaproteobacteria bacterium]
MSQLFEQLSGLYFLADQKWHRQALDESGAPRYYSRGLLTEQVLQDVLGGKETAALNLVSADGMTRTMVFDFDWSEDWPLVEKLSSVLTEELMLPEPGISVSGRRGFGLWISLVEPVPVSQARAFLRSLRSKYLRNARVDLHPDVDRPTDAGEAVMKLPPCLRRASGKWSGFIYLEECEDFSEEPWYYGRPELSQQMDRLGALDSIEPQDFRRAYERVCRTMGTVRSPEAKFFPHWNKLASDVLPACVAALVSKGVPNDWNYNTANLNLAAFCKSRNLDKTQSEGLAEEMAKNTDRDHPTSKKGVAQKLSNFRSNRNPPPFSCDYPRNTPQWRAIFDGEPICQDCPANPGLFSHDSHEKTQIGLELSVANNLLRHSWARKEALPPLGVVLPRVEVRIDSRALQVSFYELERFPTKSMVIKY